MNIAICEDTLYDIQKLACMLHKYERLNNLDLEIDIFTCGEDLIISCENKAYDVIFMDIYLVNMTGIETAKRIKKLQKCHIVFITVSKDYALDAIELDALHYLVKPADYSDIEEVMMRLKSRIPSNEYKPVEVKTNYQTFYINQLNINYIESYDKIAVIHTATQKYETYSTLSSFFELLDKDIFMRPQRSYVVNMEYISHMSGNTMILKDSTHINLSRVNRSRLKKSYEDFMLRQIRTGKKLQVQI